MEYLLPLAPLLWGFGRSSRTELSPEFLIQEGFPEAGVIVRARAFVAQKEGNWVWIGSPLTYACCGLAACGSGGMGWEGDKGYRKGRRRHSRPLEGPDEVGR